MDIFFQQIINGVIQGTIYGLCALGFALIFGVMRLIQFAHGEVIEYGSYFGFIALAVLGATSLGLPMVAAIVIGLAAAAALGVVIERIGFRPLRSAPGVATAMVTIGMSFVLRDGARLIWGPATQRYTQADLGLQQILIGDVRISFLQIAILGVSFLLIVLLQFLLYRTSLGLAIRAVAQNPLAADYIGIDSNQVIVAAFAIGSGVAGVAGVLFGFYYNAIWPTFSFNIGLKAFAATVLGGLTSVGGAIVGGMIIGLAENLGSAYIGSAWRDIVAFLILFLVLVFRPNGLFGERLVGEKESM